MVELFTTCWPIIVEEKEVMRLKNRRRIFSISYPTDIFSRLFLTFVETERFGK